MKTDEFAVILISRKKKDYCGSLLRQFNYLFVCLYNILNLIWFTYSVIPVCFVLREDVFRNSVIHF